MKDQKVRLSHHDSRWLQEYEQMRSCLLDACQGWVTATEHIGSTAITTAIAQPCIDILAGIQDEAGIPEAAMLIEGLSYRTVALPEWCEGETAVCLQKPRNGMPTHRVILTLWKGGLWHRLARMKLWLETHPEDVRRLIQVKMHLLQTTYTIEGYEQGKGIFFSALDDQISAQENRE